jgi:hypothetical protein
MLLYDTVNWANLLVCLQLTTIASGFIFTRDFRKEIRTFTCQINSDTPRSHVCERLWNVRMYVARMSFTRPNTTLILHVYCTKRDAALAFSPNEHPSCNYMFTLPASRLVCLTHP